MELAEGIVAALDHHEEHDPETCAFCKAPPEPTDETNDLTDKEDMDAIEVAGLEVDGIAFKNKAKLLGQNLIKSGDAQVETEVSLAGINGGLPVHSAAHHLIPGNATLKKSELMPYLHTDGTATGNIGYNVNNSDNGVWLVGNYALRGKNGLAKWGPEGSGFKAKYGKEPKEYAFAAISKGKCQFHDAHTDYSDFVLNELNLLAKKMDTTKDLWCPEAKEQSDDPKKRQMFMLVARLNTVSRRMQRYLENPGSAWRDNIYTSRFSKAYIKEKIRSRKRKRGE